MVFIFRWEMWLSPSDWTFLAAVVSARRNLQGVIELGGLKGREGHSAGSESVDCRERRPSAHCRERSQWPESGGQSWSAPTHLPSPSVFLFFRNKEDGETGSDWAALDLPPSFSLGWGVRVRGEGWGVSCESLNVTIIDRHLCETFVKPVFIHSWWGVFYIIPIKMSF